MYWSIIWAAFFSFLLIALNFVHHLIRKSISKKPLGSQSIYDSAIKDSFAVVRIYGSYICLLIMFSRSEMAQDLFRNHTGLLTLASVSYSFGFLCQCVSVGSVCIIRYHCHKSSLVTVIKAY
jgi:hypothetical protein